jgi:hypothetical protein
VAGRLLPDTNAFIALMRGAANVVDLFNGAAELFFLRSWASLRMAR